MKPDWTKTILWATLTGAVVPSGQALAQTVAPSPGGTGVPNLFTAGMQMIGALALLIGGLLLAIYLMRRLAGGAPKLYGGRELIRIVATKALAPKKYVALVEVGDSMLTLGITTDRITCLDKTNVQEFNSKFPPHPTPKMDGAFTRRFKEMTGVQKDEGEALPE